MRTVRRGATAIAEQLGLSERRIADLAIVATELGSNLHKHADDGVVHVRIVRGDKRAGVQLIGIDSGPGMADVDASTRDGHSTAGTLGIGLGAITRLASELDIYSQPGRGTVLAATIWDGPAPVAATVAGMTRAIAGETLSGDGYATRLHDGRLQALLTDGLGHGPLAQLTSTALGQAFRDTSASRPAAILDHLQRSASGTRGAVACVVDIDPVTSTVRSASLGNIAGWIVGAHQRRGIAAQPGFVGDRARRTIREYDYPYDDESVVVLHTDGLTDRWDLADQPGLIMRNPLVIAATLMRDAAVRRDDAGVLVIRPTVRP